MITIKVFGTTPPCVKCKEVEKRAKKIAEKYPGQVEVSKFDVVSEEGRKYKIMFPPAVVINEKVIGAGSVVSESEIEKALKKELEG